MRGRAALTGALVGGALALSGVGTRLENAIALPALYLARGPRVPPPAAAVVGVDAASLAGFAIDASALDDAAPRLAACLGPEERGALAALGGADRLPRPVLACAIGVAAADGAAAIAVDVSLRAGGDEDADARLARAIADAAPVFLLDRVDRDLATGALVRRPPAEPFRRAAAGHGHFVIVRRAGVVDYYARRLDAYPGSRALSAMAADVLRDPSARRPDEGPATVGLDLYGGPGAIRTIPLADLFQDAPDPGRFAGRVVFVGAADLRSAKEDDSFDTAWPGHDAHPGVELLATAFLNEVEGRTRRRAPAAAEAALVAGLGAAFAAVRWPAAAMAIAAAWVAAAAAAFSMKAWQLPVAVPALVLLPGVLAAQLLARQARLRAALKRLVPRPLLTSTLDRATPRQTLGEHAALMFDLVASTAYADRFGELALNRRLAQLFDIVQRAVEDEKGFIVKFTGDGGLALFAARPPAPDHAAAACRAALAIRRGVDAANAVARPGAAPLRVRVGVHAGPVMVGLIGGGERDAIDAVGDAVNVAARLEALAKAERPDDACAILVGGAAQAMLPPGAFVLDDLGKRALPGKASLVRVYALRS